MDDERGWSTARDFATGLVAVGSLALAALLFIIGMIFAAAVFGGTLALQAGLVVASLCCLAAALLVIMTAIGIGPPWSYPVAAAALVLAAVLIFITTGWLLVSLISALLALVTSWWAPR